MIDRSQLLEKLERGVGAGNLSIGLELLSAYVGAEHYLLSRYDVFSEDAYAFVISSDWPFDLVRSFGAALTRRYSKRNEVDRCMEAYEPQFASCPGDLRLPAHLSEAYCSIPFNAGQARLLLTFLMRADVIVARDRMHDVALMASYYCSRFEHAAYAPENVLDLTEREIECLNWIAEGKTSDEMSVIIGISRNTVNNYITSIMRKTATKTRSEAIAFAVRNSLI